MNLSVVVPVYNEGRGIRECLRRVESFLDLKGDAWEIIVSSDGSTDNTNQEVRAFISESPVRKERIHLIASETNKGKGHASRLGVLKAQGRMILITDADLSAPIKEVDKLIAEIEKGHDIAIGSRAAREPGADVRQSFKRRLAGRIFNILVQILALRGIGDTQCGFKCFKREVAHDLFSNQKIDGFTFDVEILLLARKKGYTIKEKAVMWSEGPDSRVRLARDSWRMLKDLLKIA
ncbi:MAG: glycosyltransferase family 2 protein [Candidatus Omnitrophica bacterium]|nr:glycosyltransferase family 2 protein [Candidatus Omnitrophota bacterium]